MNQKQQILYFDLLNITANICVIALHCNGIVHSFSNTRAWKESLIVEVLAYWAVPIFFMLTGATLMRYRERYTTKEFFQKRFIKTVLPFFAWSCIILVDKLLFNKIQIEQTTVPYFIHLIMNTKIEGTYWFFIPLFMAYASLPCLSILSQNKNILKYMLGIGGITYAVLPLFCSLFSITFNGQLYFPLTGGYILFVILGYWLTTIHISYLGRIGIYILAWGGAIARYISTYTGSIQTGTLYKVFWGYLNLPSVLLALGVFVFFQYFNWEWLQKYSGQIQKLSSMTFGIYLVHMMVINHLCWFFDIDVTRTYWRIGGIVGVYIIALAIVYTLKKIKYLRWLVPD